ncbi:MCE family protein [Pseudonocardia spinosispora]|uniref:MCE family protein n=1 Tax=Pseudonocardia spinosispora TaxID=103441 RepID=UPI0004114C92|nr:MCE family protein [Pseudonocardia spinosispora]
MRLRFREKNPVTIAFVGIAILLVLLFGSFQLAALPVFAGTTYKAVFDEAGGLTAGDKVKVAGTEVGKVSSVDLEDGDVVVTFTARDVTLGQRSTAAITTQTLLGERDLALVSTGPGAMGSGDTIPIERTRSPYNLTDDLNELSDRTSQIDTVQVGKALDAFSQAFTDTPDDIKPTFDGLTRVSRTINERNEALQTLLHHAEQATGVLRQHTGQLTTLIGDGNQLLEELDARRQAIHQLLVSTKDVTDQVSGLVHDQNDRLKPALDELNRTMEILRRNEGNLTSAVGRVAAFITPLGEGLAGGTWFQGFGDLSGSVATKFPTNNFIPGAPVPIKPAPKGSIPTVPSVPGLLGVGGNN